MQKITFCANSAQHDSLHFVNFRRFCGSVVDVVVVVVVVVAAGVNGVVAFWADINGVLALA